MNEANLLKLERLAELMDDRFVIPGTDIRIGLDAVMGLVPGIGDTASLLVSAYIIHKSRKAGVQPFIISRMGYNVFVDWLIGLVPLFGDIFDIGFHANRKNIDLLKGHFKTRPADTKNGNALFI